MCFETISAKDLENYIERKNTLLVDLRDANEYQQGHIEGAVNIPYEELEQRLYMFNFYTLIVLYCDRGSISMLAARALCSRGYYVKSVYGGIHAYRGKLVK